MTDVFTANWLTVELPRSGFVQQAKYAIVKAHLRTLATTL